MKVFISLLIGFLSLQLVAFAQLSLSAFPLASRNFDVKSLSLGNATVSLSGDDGNSQINPAGVGVDEVFQLSPDYSFFHQPNRLSYERFSLKGNYKLGQSAFSFSLENIDSGEQSTLMGYPTGFSYKFNNREVFVRAGYSYEFENNLRLGGSLNYLYGGEASGNEFTAIKTDAVNTWSIDLGLQYQFSRKIDDVLIQPNFGVALTNFGKPVSYFDENTSPMPTKLQTGLGVVLSSSSQVFQQNLFKVTLLQSASKILSRIEQKGSASNNRWEAMNPFKALVQAWSTYEYFDGQRTSSIKPQQQIWVQTGIDVEVLETFSIRWGYEHAGQAQQVLTYQSLGLGIDLFYVALDYAFVLRNADMMNYLQGHWWQLTGRIPLGRSTPNTLLHQLFNN